MSRVSRRFGQHFLDSTWVKKIVNAIDPDPTETFLEVGPGRGALTLELAKRVKHLTAIEIDPRLVEKLKSHAPANVSIIKGDFLKLDIAPLLDLNAQLRMVGNLPYGIGSPIMIKLLKLSRNGTCLKDATVMLQREVAAKVTAEPPSPDWGPLAATVRLHGEAKRLFNVPPGAFRPIPRVSSSVVHLRFCPSPVHLSDPSLFDLLVRTLFTQRRKTVFNALKPLLPKISTLSIQEVLVLTKINPRSRPGDLNLSELAEISEVLASFKL